MMSVRFALLPPLCLLGACQSPGGDPAATPAPTATESAAIPKSDEPQEEISLVGTEPFWGGKISGTQITYTTPENQQGATATVARFAGLNGVSYSGSLDGRTFDLLLTEARCSDGMSDRSYPMTVLLRFADETRNGCAWTPSRPFDGPANP